MTPDEILRDSHARWPMQQSELDRLHERRWVLDMLPKGGVGAEIGVFRGHFTALICEIAQPRRLYLIDPWTKLGETFGWGEEYTCFDTLTTLAAREDSRAHAARFPQTESILIEDIYPECREQVLDLLDFAYLDAGHQYQRTYWELSQVATQMAPGAFILGDDWDPRPGSEHHGVWQAIMTFTAETDWRVLKAGHGRQWILSRDA